MFAIDRHQRNLPSAFSRAIPLEALYPWSHPRQPGRLRATTREINSERKLICQAHFPVFKTRDEFQFTNIPALNRQLVLELTQGNYIQAKLSWASPPVVRGIGFASPLPPV